MANKAKAQGKTTGAAVQAATDGSSDSNEQLRTEVFEIFRRWGYLQATLDPLKQYLPAEPFPIDLPEGSDSIAEEARRYYCGNLALEFSHIASPEKREWLQAKMEQRPVETKQQQAHTLTSLIKADLFEATIQQRYLGTKRFSLEGLTALVPFLDRVFEVSAAQGVERCNFAMSHRGRLNVMVNTVGRSAADIFTKFEDVDPRSHLGGGDVKYHQGATGSYTAPDGKKIALHLASNPSHLEAADPVVMGRARARQVRLGEDGPKRVLPIIIHGDAAFAGQGIWAETLVLATINGYTVGGTIQVVVNNLLGFTAEPLESNSSRFATDMAKRLPIPIFHVNAEDPDAVVRVAAIAAEYRATFASDVVVDLIGYRRHGHSEVDDPTVTQPRRYAKIKETAPLYKSYAERLGVDASAEIKAISDKFLADQALGKEAEHPPTLSELPSYWNNYKGGYLPAHDPAVTGLPVEEIKRLTAQLTTAPDGLSSAPQDQGSAEAARRNGHGRKAVRLRHGRVAGVCFAAGKGHARTPVRAGFAARHIQSAALVLYGYRDREALVAVAESLTGSGPLRGLQQHAERSRGAWL